MGEKKEDKKIEVFQRHAYFVIPDKYMIIVVKLNFGGSFNQDFGNDLGPLFFLNEENAKFCLKEIVKKERDELRKKISQKNLIIYNIDQSGPIQSAQVYCAIELDNIVKNNEEFEDYDDYDDEND